MEYPCRRELRAPERLFTALKHLSQLRSGRFLMRASLITARIAILALAPALGAAALVACSRPSQSLADYIAAVCQTSFGSAPAEEAPYLAENVDAMTKMMVDMGIRPTGDVDRDFVAMMVPHHQGAIAMARAELRYGHNERLRRMAQGIIVAQQQEIAAMHLAVGEPLEHPTGALDGRRLADEVDVGQSTSK